MRIYYMINIEIVDLCDRKYRNRLFYFNHNDAFVTGS